MRYHRDRYPDKRTVMLPGGLYMKKVSAMAAEAQIR